VFDNQTTARSMIFVALDTIPGLKQKRIEYIRLVDKSNSSELQADEHERLVHVRSALSNLLFEHVLLNGEGSGSQFLDNTGMQALVGSKRSFLDRTDSFGAAVRFALPGLIHESSPGCIRPHQIEHFHLNDPEYCQRVFRHELSLVMPSQLNAYLEAYTKSGDTSARPGTAQDKQIAIQNLASEIRKQILQRGASGGEHWLTEKKMLSLISRTGLKNSFVARLKRCEARRGKRAKKPEVYPLRYTEDFFAKFNEVAARISSTGAEDIFETGSSKKLGLKTSSFGGLL
jgi:hypothetical protein